MVTRMWFSKLFKHGAIRQGVAPLLCCKLTKSEPQFAGEPCRNTFLANRRNQTAGGVLSTRAPYWEIKTPHGMPHGTPHGAPLPHGARHTRRTRRRTAVHTAPHGAVCESFFPGIPRRPRGWTPSLSRNLLRVVPCKSLSVPSKSVRVYKGFC